MKPPSHSATVAAPSAGDSTTHFSRLDELLWAERALLERLAYRLAAQQMALAVDEARWLRLSDGEVAAALRDVRRHEVLRAVETERVLSELGLPSATALAGLASAAPAPWTIILDEHRNAMCRLEAEVRARADETVQLLLEARRAADGDPR